LKDIGDVEHMEEVVSLTFQYFKILHQHGVVEWMFEKVLEFSMTNPFLEVMGIMVFELHQQIIYSNYLP
jgi:secreted Zn-dependent insulinase-like peptidase